MDYRIVSVLIGEVIGPHLIVQILVIILKTGEFYA